MSNNTKPLTGDEITISQKLVRGADGERYRRTGRVRLPRVGETFLIPASVGYVFTGTEMLHEYEILDLIEE